MQVVLIVFCLIILPIAVILFCIYKYDRAKAESEERSKIAFTIHPDYGAIVGMPVGLSLAFYCLSLAVSGYFKIDNWMFNILLSSFMNLMAVFFILQKMLVRINLNEEGVEIRNLIKNRSEQIPYQNIIRIGIYRSARSRSYFIDYKKGETSDRITINSGQMHSLEKFIKIFADHGVPYY